MSGLNKTQLPQLKRVLKFYKVSSNVTGVFLLLLMVTWGIRRLPFLGFDFWLFGPNGFLAFEQYGIEGEGLPDAGINLTVWILIIHGWLYVVYLFADFRVWTLMRWSFTRFLLIAMGGVIPLMSFITENRYAKIVHKEILKLEQR